MTWFRKMERSGLKIHWIEGEKSMDIKIIEAIKVLNTKKEG
jgi:hypothetical protein